MNRSQGNLQDAFLNSARRDNVGVTIYLVSGVQLRGVIRAFDAFTVLLESQGRPAQMVYKHAIASVAPVRNVAMETGSARDEATGQERARSEDDAGAGQESGLHSETGPPQRHPDPAETGAEGADTDQSPPEHG